MIYKKSPKLGYKYRKRKLWCEGYYVKTEGKNAKKMEEDKAERTC